MKKWPMLAYLQAPAIFYKRKPSAEPMILKSFSHAQEKNPPLVE